MFPVLLAIGPFTLTSFGFFVGLALILGSFIIWRLANVYDIDSEKILDFVILTFLGGVIGSRLAYILFNLDKVDSLWKMILINRYPGLIFWGGLLAGALVLWILVKRSKLDFWLIADIGLVGLFAGLSLGSLGCLFSSCQYGIASDSFFAVTQAGVIGRRIPVQLLFSILYLLIYLYLWRSCLRFHFKGKVASLGLIFLGLIKFILSFLRADTRYIGFGITFEQIFSLITLTLGILIFYRLSKRKILADLSMSYKIILSSKLRKGLLLSMLKSWYNLRVKIKVKLAKGKKKLTRRLNVKATPSEF